MTARNPVALEAPLQAIPPWVAALSDYETLSHQRLEAGIHAYLFDGAGDGGTLRANQEALRSLKLHSHVLRDLSGGHCRRRLLGQDMALPLLLAPVAFQKLAHPEGERATALAATALGIPMVVSTQASITLEDVADGLDGPFWFQLYMQHDRSFTEQLVRRAERAGYRALVVTLDAPVTGIRNAEQRAGFRLPDDVQAANLAGLSPLAQDDEGDIMLLNSRLLNSAPGWDDLKWLCGITHLPVFAKGILEARDAVEALDLGAQGIIVSNHGGRTLDCLPATAQVLPEIVKAVDGRAPVLMDGGIRSGGDIFKALALGADAVLIGRGFLHALAAAGAIGVAHAIRILRAELEVTMALTGCRDLAAITPNCLRT